jgi:hypothetical protein
MLQHRDQRSLFPCLSMSMSSLVITWQMCEQCQNKDKVRWDGICGRTLMFSPPGMFLSLARMSSRSLSRLASEGGLRGILFLDLGSSVLVVIGCKIVSRTFSKI